MAGTRKRKCIKYWAKRPKFCALDQKQAMVKEFDMYKKDLEIGNIPFDIFISLYAVIKKDWEPQLLYKFSSRPSEYQIRINGYSI